ncbi:MAG: hypothetical protein K8T89_04410 [Planctomycetes bacterium]|nr:hypothetical protein [Planctomycetota bacterium]
MQNSQSIIDGFAQRLIRRKARRLAGRYGFSRSDREDLEQELSLFLVDKLRELDRIIANREAFLTTMLNRFVATLVRKNRSQRWCRRRELSLSIGVPDEEGQLVPWERLLSEEDNQARPGHEPLPESERQDLQIDTASVIANMPPRLRRLCRLLRENSVTDCARKLHIPRTTLNDHIRELRPYFEKAGLAKDFRESAVTRPEFRVVDLLEDRAKPETEELELLGSRQQPPHSSGDPS